MKERTFPAGATLAVEGEEGVGFFLIEEGRARVTVRGSEVGELGPGDYLGELALIVETPRTATVTAETDVRCYGLTSWDFRQLVETNASFSWKVLEATARLLLETQNRTPLS